MIIPEPTLDEQFRYRRPRGRTAIFDLIDATPPGEPVGLTRNEIALMALPGTIAVTGDDGRRFALDGRRVVMIPDDWFLPLDIHTYTHRSQP